MPQTRKSSRGGKQSTLSFNHRVTKSVPKSAKDAAASSVVSKPSPLSKSSKPDDDEVEEQQQQQQQQQPEPVKVEAVPAVEPEVEEDDEEAAAEEEVVPEKSAAEIKAEKMSDAQIAKYWRGLEAEVTAKRVHQEDLSVGEKVLRYFDVSSQYGPCIGITRMKRWMRAEKLGLNPPVEALAVLLKEEAGGNKTIERAQIDEIMGSVAIGTV